MVSRQAVINLNEEFRTGILSQTYQGTQRSKMPAKHNDCRYCEAKPIANMISDVASQMNFAMSGQLKGKAFWRWMRVGTTRHRSQHRIVDPVYHTLSKYYVGP